MIRQGGVEMKKPSCWNPCWLIVLGVLGSACGAAPESRAAQTPQLVAAYPRAAAGEGSAQADPDGPVVWESVYLTLEVDDPEGAAGEAARAARGYGGYEAARYGWPAEGGRAVSQEIFVPAVRAEDFRRRLLQLGWKNEESVARRSDAGYGFEYGWTEFSIRYLPAERIYVGKPAFSEEILRAFCGWALQAALVLLHTAASILLAAAVAVPFLLMIVGAVTTVRWLLRK
jgi:hypothetical protein